jgi:peroxiredoxin
MTDQLLELPPDVVSQHGLALDDLSRASPVLAVCLRHSGCTFCRQALSDLQRDRAAIEGAGTTIVLVHMLSDADAAAMFARYGLDDLPRFSDPERRLYAALGLERGSTWRVMGPQMWGRAIGSLLSGHGFGIPKGDVHQMPGAFLLHDGRIVAAFRHAGSGDRPDYCELARLPETSG